jgi:Mn2+/Fe2+ NRAMP family transporter
MGSLNDLHVSPPPVTLRDRVRWLGPGIIWLAAGAGGAGELLFPPRVGSLYGYSFLWILLISIFFKWIIVREIGRWAVCTGTTFVDGLKQMNYSYQWPLWLILVPQIFIGSASIAGLGGSAATALILFVDLDIRIWLIIAIVTSTVLLITGRYKRIENIATIITSILGVIAVVTALMVFPQAKKFLQGMVPSLPQDTDYGEILPWLSYVLAGAAGMIWYSYWLPAKGYGARQINETGQEAFATEKGRQYLGGWIRQMTLDISVGIIAGTIIVLAFLILGAELLGPKKIVPEENKVAETLGGMLKNLWGATGYWLMIVGVFAGFWGTVLTNQDGWARMLANGMRVLFPASKSKWLRNEQRLKKLFVVFIFTMLPIVIYLIAGEPVGLLQIGGIIQVMLIPFTAVFVLRMNQKLLPVSLKPSTSTSILVYAGALCFSICVVAYLAQLAGLLQ